MTIKIGFVGFHQSFVPRHRAIVRMLQSHFPLDIVDAPAGEVPNFLFFSVYGYPHRDPRFDKCHKIFTCEENIRIPWTECDHAVTGDYLDDQRHLRLPIYAVSMIEKSRHPCHDLLKPKRDLRQLLATKTKFCNFVVSNPHSRPRLKFLEILSEYKKVDSGGLVLNNIGRPVEDKLSFARQYKFTIAFENSRHPGYVTEKIVEAMMSDSLPIYWGDRNVVQELNPRSFVDANEPADCPSLVEHFEKIASEVARLDQDDDAYLAKMAEPWLPGNEPSPYLHPNYMLDFFEKVFSTPREDVGKYRLRAPLQSWEDLEGRDWMKPSYWTNHHD